ncbi:MAG: phage portal protein [Chloroflexi bacterium]|nr:phage portal protein [Chloroflexota bacterium]
MDGKSPFPILLSRMDPERLRRYREYLDFYHGRQWPAPSRRKERRLVLNYAKVVVEKTTSYLMSEVSHAAEPWEDSPEARGRARAAETLLAQVGEENNLAQLDFDTELDAAVLGDGCYKVTWDAVAGSVRVTAPDVQGLYAWWAGDDLSRVWRVASRYRLSAEEMEALYGPQLDARSGWLRGLAPRRAWTVTELWTEGEFQLWLDHQLVEAKPNPYGFIPFVIYPNLREPKEFWGVSDLAPLVEPARELNRALTQLSAILELSGNPIAVLENVEEAQDIAVQPGAVWELPERAKAYLLDLLQGGGVQLHVSYADLLYRALYDLSETPRTSFGDNQRALSGIALEMELHPLLQKVKRKRLIRSAAYRRRNEMILRIVEQQTGQRFGPLRLSIQWGPVLPQDRSRLVADEVSLVSAGIHSRRRAADLLGVPDPEAEWQRWREEEEGRHQV